MNNKIKTKANTILKFKMKEEENIVIKMLIVTLK
jgi:hypothetical protein